MNVLALETSTPYLCLGWLEPDAPALQRRLELGRAHAERAVVELEAFLKEARATRADLIAVGTGPGSYTGVRVGVSLALGLARGWDAQVVGVPTLEALAAQGHGLVAVTLDARKGNAYSALYRVEAGRILETLLAPEKRDLEAFKALCPDGSTWLSESALGGAALAKLGLERFQRGERGVSVSYL